MRLYGAALAEGDPYGLVISDEQFDAHSTFDGTEGIRRMRESERAHRATAASPATPAVFILWTAHSADEVLKVEPPGVDSDGPDSVWAKPLPPWKCGRVQALLHRLLCERGHGV